MGDKSVPELLDAVRGGDPAPGEVAAAADRIAALGVGAVPPLLEALGDEDEAVLAVSAAALRRLPSPGLTQRLVGLLRSPRLGDVAKALVLGLLEDAGMDIHDPSFVGTVVDIGAVVAEGLAPQGPPEEEGNGRAHPRPPPDRPEAPSRSEDSR